MMMMFRVHPQVRIGFYIYFYLLKKLPGNTSQNKQVNLS